MLKRNHFSFFIAALLLVVPLTAWADFGSPVKFFNDSTVLNGYIGERVYMDGDNAVIGSRVGNHLMVRDMSDVWSQNGSIGGESISIDGNFMVLGYPSYDPPGLANAGRADVYVLTAGVWTFQMSLYPSDHAAGDSFGRSVAISGDILIVGANYKTGPSGQISAGAAYVFKFDGVSDWTEEAKLLASPILTTPNFGYSCDLDGNRAIIGAIHESSSSGTVYFFERDAAETWHQVSRLPSSAGTSGSLGWSVGISGDYAVAGTGFKHKAYIYSRDGAPDGSGTWTVDSSLGTDASTYFGYSADIEGDVVVIGAYAEGLGGSVYSYVRDAATRFWSGQETMTGLLQTRVPHISTPSAV
jgi:hypothetical protein